METREEMKTIFHAQRNDRTPRRAKKDGRERNPNADKLTFYTARMQRCRLTLFVKYEKTMARIFGFQIDFIVNLYFGAKSET